PAIRRWARSRDGPPGAAYPHQRLSALCSPRFFLGAETDKGIPAPLKPGGEALTHGEQPRWNATMCLREQRRSWTFARAGVDNDSQAIFSAGCRASPERGRTDWGRAFKRRTWGA